MDHSQDSECSVDPETDLCRECGAEHGEPCTHCRARAFHLPNCLVRVARGELTIGELDRMDPPAGRYVAVKTTVLKGGQVLARATSKTIAKRIAKALNIEVEGRRGA